MSNEGQTDAIWQVLFSRDLAIAKAREKHKADYEEILRLHQQLQQNSELLLPQLAERESVIQEKQQTIEELAIASGDRLQIIEEQTQKIAQLEYEIEQLKQHHQERIRQIRRSKREAVQKIITAAKSQQAFIRDQAEQIKVLKRSLESTVDRRLRRRFSKLSRFFD